MPAPNIETDTAGNANLTFSPAFSFDYLPSSFRTTGFVASISEYPIPQLAGSNVTFLLPSFSPSADVIRVQVQPSSDMAMSVGLYVAAPGQSFSIPDSSPVISISMHVPPFNVTGSLASNATIELVPASPNEDIINANRSDSTPLSSLPSCPSYNDPQVLYGSFFQLNFSDTLEASCAFYIPIAGLGNGSAASGFSIRPFKLDGYSYISVYANVSEPPVQIIKTNSLFVFDASTFANYGGVLITINVAGTYQPFEVVLAVASSCPSPQIPLGFLSYTDALLLGGSLSLPQPPFTICINPASFLLGNASINYSLLFNTSQLPAYYVPAFIALFNPPATNLRAGLCYYANTSDPNPGVSSDLFLDFNPAASNTGVSRHHRRLLAATSASEAHYVHHNSRKHRHSSSGRPIKTLTHRRSAAAAPLSSPFSFDFLTADADISSSGVVCMPPQGILAAAVVYSVNGTIAASPAGLVLATLSLTLLPNVTTPSPPAVLPPPPSFHVNGSNSTKTSPPAPPVSTIVANPEVGTSSAPSQTAAFKSSANALRSMHLMTFWTTMACVLLLML
ncbi:hypothetical protein CEUSTIGMA_g10946.t1 [Chlamydomonas eustigma]|uniref:Uncharacterized protein n=1 Tax=Chlamydomonas eustigma TaxID=1157962 RepID=A0A250XKA8_9CHLO|nr:hypothetical protein CEUSTIGMA_g10946.t1 [Chlamydomonas eustigma]|eukprot:GAX83521.1 hypothetical protein CEUSTIGMA_g10946.t1 [Chlamydomonas eustigma]